MEGRYYIAIWYPIQAKFEIMISVNNLSEAEVLHSAYTNTYPNYGVVLLDMLKGITEHKYNKVKGKGNE